MHTTIVANCEPNETVNNTMHTCWWPTFQDFVFHPLHLCSWHSGGQRSQLLQHSDSSLCLIHAVYVKLQGRLQ
jgi:hypothetical protein